MIKAPGKFSDTLAMDDPQFLQNFRNSGLPRTPLSPKFARPSPFMVTLDVGTTTLTENAEPDAFWL